MSKSKKVKKASEDLKPVRTLHYFAEDGNYGSASGYVVMETTHWQEVDWEIIESASDEHRPTVARLITESYEPDANEEALREAFERYGVDLSIFEK
jgi:hypothetical protein